MVSLIFGTLLAGIATHQRNTEVESTPAVHDSSTAYYAVFFSYQTPDNRIKLSHTFAAFIRAEKEHDQFRVAKCCTISWLPVSEKISLVRPAEVGFNKPLEKTLAWAREQDLDVRIFGPVAISEHFFRLAEAQARRLDDHRFQYKAFDDYTRNAAINCIHAVSDIDQEREPLNTGVARGHEATNMVIEHLRPHFLSDAPLSANQQSALLVAIGVNRGEFE